MNLCPKCGHEFLIPLPVEPLWSLQSACLLIPCSPGALRGWLYKHKGQVSSHYRKGKRPVRLLTGADINTIRAYMISHTRFRIPH
jgi:hypothetical protein